MSMSLPHAISAHAQLQTTRTASEQFNAAQPNLNQANEANQQALTTPSTFVTLSEKSKQLSQDETAQSVHSPLSADKKSEKAEQKEIELLRQRDQEVKIHERAHATIGGQYASAPTYTYETGPDDRRYATDGEVNIDLTPIPNDPEATIDKMQQVYRAALAPTQPSTQDRIVAAEARQTITAAKIEQTKTTEKMDSDAENTPLVDKKVQDYLASYLQHQDSN